MAFTGTTSRITGLVLVAVLGAARLSGAGAPALVPRVFLLGGSTLADQPSTGLLRGWGQLFPQCFIDPALVQNRAASGRSSKSFIDQGRWDAVLAELRPGDYVLIQFGGGNDAKKEDPARYAEPQGAYRANLYRIIRETRAKGAFPLLATMGTVRAWDTDGRFISPPFEWVDVTREVAREQNVPLLDLRARTIELESSLGPEGSAALHLHLPPGKFTEYPNGAKDDTHYSNYGASRVAALAVQEIRRLDLPLAKYLTDIAPENAPRASKAGSKILKPSSP